MKVKDLIKSLQSVEAECGNIDILHHNEFTKNYPWPQRRVPAITIEKDVEGVESIIFGAKDDG